MPERLSRAAPEMRFWGWGDPNRPAALPGHAVEFLRAEVGIADAPRPPVALEAIALPDSQLPDAARAALVATGSAVREDQAARVVHAAGKGYWDLVRQRRGECHQAPDAVVLPGDHDEVRAVLEACAEHGVAVVPFGGGTSVVGGVEPLRGGFASVVALDLSRLDQLVHVDRAALTAVLDAGVRGPDAEAMLHAQGLTLGHFPQSYEYASIGGYVATRSAGQASTGYGRVDELVLGLRCAAPAGDVIVRPLPASAAGPALRELLVGSEGTLGVITQVALRVRPEPAERRYEGWFFRSFEEGAEAFRTLEQDDAAPDVARLSDEDETRMSLALAGREGLKARLGDSYLRLRGYEGGCLAILGWEGAEDDVARRGARTSALARRCGGLALGRSPGEAWAHGRFEGPYLRDDLLAHGVMVETLETATQWSGVMALHRAVSAALREALSARGTPPLVMCHISHLYPSGASLYFTFLARQQEGAELEQWQAAKHAASNAIADHGATITHHHAIGRDHLPWMRAEVGDTGLAVLRAVKAQLDPAGIMNPGKLIP
ncbi:MAG TPA: FAD-binding oxidoreductase [Solirubrobacteraceae bacterium]|nr:FAD-binding oxidoreductase [Solirubrobacteraceae bacterium]